jgi:hypothetical protein
VTEAEETPYASGARRCGASLFDGFLLVGPALAAPVFGIVAGGAGRGVDGLGVLTAVAGISALGALAVLSLQSIVLATRGVTLGMAFRGIRLQGGSPFRRFLAPALAIGLPVGGVLVFYAVQAVTDGATFQSAIENLEEAFVWIPFFLLALNALTLLVSKRPLVDWLAGGRAVAVSQEPLGTERAATGLLALDYALVAGSTLPSMTGLILAPKEGGSIAAFAVCVAFATGGLLAAEARSRATTGKTIGQRTLEEQRK